MELGVLSLEGEVFCQLCAKRHPDKLAYARREVAGDVLPQLRFLKKIILASMVLLPAHLFIYEACHKYETWWWLHLIKSPVDRRVNNSLYFKVKYSSIY